MSDADPVIVVEDLHKRFGTRDILRGISFSVNKGETLAILGRSGTGKSVTLKILMGLLTPTSGSARVLGQELYRLPKKELFAARRQMGYVFQGGALFDSLSILENVGFPLYQSRVPDSEVLERVTERLKMVGLGHTLYQRPTELSGGMQKRAALARAIIDLPQVVFYDEPTSGLDPLTTDVINQIILRLRSLLKVTSIVVTHDMSSAFTIADRIIMLDQGRVVAQGTPQEIEGNESPWVQHFIAGRALEDEAINTGAFASVGRMSRSKSISGRRVHVRGELTGTRIAAPAAAPDPRNGSGLHRMPPPIRNRRKTTDSGENERPSSGRLPPAVSNRQSAVSNPRAATAEPIDLDDESAD